MQVKNEADLPWLVCLSLEDGTENQRVTGSIPSLENMPVLWARSPVGGA